MGFQYAYHYFNYYKLLFISNKIGSKNRFSRKGHFLKMPEAEEEEEKESNF